MENKNIVFLTGINGFLGSHIAKELVARGYKVVGLIRNEASNPLLKNCDVEYCKGELLNPKTYEDALASCNIVIHTAAVTSFGVMRIRDYYDTNFKGTKLLLEYSRKHHIQRFIHAGTRGTLGIDKTPSQSDENTPTKRINDMDDYIKSKYLAEQEVLKLSRSKNETMACIILSPTALIGACDFKPTPIGNIILTFLRKKNHFYVYGGINVIDVDDAAYGFVAAIDKGRNGQAYILGNKNITLYELFSELSELSQVPLPKLKIPFIGAYAVAFATEILSKIRGTAPFATRKKVVSLYRKYSYCNSKKAILEFNLPQTTLKETLRKTIDWYRENSYI